MMAPKEVRTFSIRRKNLQRKDVPLPDFEYYYDRIHAPGSHNISFCWLDYLYNDKLTKEHILMDRLYKLPCPVWLKHLKSSC